MKATFLILAVAAASVASAATINTGVDNSNVPLTNSGLTVGTQVTDGHWTVSGPSLASTSAVTVANLFSSAYFHSGSNPIGTNTADWITVVSSNTNSQSPAGIYVFTETFTAGASGTLSGIWATDNCGQLSISGGASVTAGATIGSGQTTTTCNGGSSANFNVPTAFTISGLVANTTYTISASVVNTDGPTAFLLDTGANNTPEPASILSVVTGLGLIGIASRRRKA